MTSDIQDKTTNLTDNILVSDGEHFIAEDGGTTTTSGTPISDEAIDELVPFDNPAPAPVEDLVIVGTSGDDSLAGGEGNDTFRAGRGNDLIIGNGGNDDVRAGGGDDTIFGDTGDDFLRGEDGDDVIDGGEGADTIEGGNGVDTASYANSDAAVTVSLRQGSAPQSRGDAEGDILRNIENLEGSNFDDVLIGNDATNLLMGGDGDDLIEGGGGRDTVDGGAGDDVIVAINSSFGQTYLGGTGDDTLRAVSRVELRTDDIQGFETLEIAAVEGVNALARLNFDQMTFEEIAFAAADERGVTVEIIADEANDLNLSDVVLTGFDADRDVFDITGNGEANFIVSTAVRDEIAAGSGNDTINSGAGDDDVRAGNGDDIIFGGAGDDFLRGEDGNDGIFGGEGADTIEGGNGVDAVSYFFSKEGVQVALNIGSDAQSGGDAEGDILRNIENLGGSNFADEITGNNAANLLLGAGGDDVIDGRGGADTIEGGDGDDVIVAVNASGRIFDGGEGQDTLRVLTADDLRNDNLIGIETLEIVADPGRDARVILNATQASELEAISFVSTGGRGVRVEVVDDRVPEIDLSGLTLTGFDPERDVFEITGNEFNDTIIGTAVRDEIDGGRGNDNITGGAGDDVINGNRGRDKIFGGAGDDNVRGGSENDTVFGGAGDDFVRGDDGNDVLDGGAGADVIEGGNGRDTASYADSDAAVEVSLAIGGAAQRGGEAEGDVLRSIENLTGSAHDDTLTGNDGANVLRGGAGDDVLEGRGGADTVRGEAGDDLVIVRDGAGRSFIGGTGFDTLRVIDRVGLNGDDKATGFEALEIVAAAGRNALLRIDAADMTFEQIAFETQNGRAAFVEIFGDGATAVDLSEVALSGFDGADEFRFFGAAGDDAFSGTALADRIEGRGGDDTLQGGGGDDDIEGGDGNDVLIGGAGGDRMVGGNGVDRVDYSASDAGIDIVLDNGNRRGDGGDAAGDRLGSIEDVTGSAFDDLVRGSNAANRIDSGAGDDVVDGLGGNDRLDGGAGNDVLSGGSGNDLLIGGAGNDLLSGGSGDDTFDFTERRGFGDDRVEDFERGDLIRLLEEDGVTRFEDLEIVQTDVQLGNGAVRIDTVIELENGTVTLEGFDSTLQASDFEFI